jgi:hypothetical protein
MNKQRLKIIIMEEIIRCIIIFSVAIIVLKCCNLIIK